MKKYFLFNGKDSRDFDIQISEYPPIVKPRERVETITIPGRSGSLHIKEDEHIFESYVKPFNIVALDPQRIPEINEWLQGSGELVVGNENDWIYDGYISEAFEFTRFFRGWHRATVNVEVQPFKKSKRVYTQPLQSGDVDNYIQCNSKYPTPYVIDMMEHPHGFSWFMVNGYMLKTILTAGDEHTGWAQLISEKGIVKFQKTDDPQSPIITMPLLMRNQNAMYLQNGTNTIKIHKPCLGNSSISYRELTV